MSNSQTIIGCIAPADDHGRVHKDKIGEVSIRLGSSDETWTRALRHVLLDLKILLADAVR